MEKYFTIGEMAKLHGISAQKLRYYDKIGLFSPTLVNEENSYRYYSLEQFSELDMILFLGKMNISLKDIKRYINNHNLGSMKHMLNEIKESVYKEIENLMVIAKRSDYQLDLIKKYEEFDEENHIKLSLQPERYMLESFCKEKSKKLSYYKGIKGILSKVEKGEILYEGIPGYIIVKDDLDNGKYLLQRNLFMIGEEKVFLEKGGKIINKGIYGTISFKGNGTDAEMKYHMLLEWIHDKGCKIVGDGLFLYIIDSSYTKDENEYFTEIQIPVEMP